MQLAHKFPSILDTRKRCRAPLATAVQNRRAPFVLRRQSGAATALSHAILATLVLAFFASALDVSARITPRSKKQDAADADAFFATNGVVVLKIEISEAGVASLKKNHRKNVSATIREGNKVYEDVALHIKGSAGSFRGFDDKPGLTLNFASLEASDYFHGLRKFHLNNGAQDGTYVSEMMCSTLFRAAGVPASRATHAIVELNGRKLGLFVLLEGMEKSFLGKHFKDPSGSLYGQSGGGDVSDALERMEGHEPLTRDDLKALAAAANEPDGARRLELLRKRLDVDRFLSFMALEVMLCHWDGYTFARHNYRVYHDVDTDRMVFFPHDMDQMLGDANLAVEPGVNGLIAQAVMRTPELRAQYRQRFGQIFTNHFVVPALTNQIHLIVQRAAPGMKAYNPKLGTDFANNVASFRDRIINRGKSLERLLTQPPPEPMRFVNGVAKLTRAEWRKEPDAASLDRVKHAEGRATFWIKAAGDAAASWRARLQLPAGRYRFEAAARGKDIAPVPNDPKGLGAGLRISGNTEPRPDKLIGTTGWENLAYEFDVPSGPLDVDLVAELRATKGEVWFDTDSLKLVKLK